MDEADKKRLKWINEQADRMTDSVLGKVMASPMSWAVLGVSHLIAFLLGVWASR